MSVGATSLLQGWLGDNIVHQPFEDEETIDAEIAKFLSWAFVNHRMTKATYDNLFIDLDSEFEAYYHKLLNAGGFGGDAARMDAIQP